LKAEVTKFPESCFVLRGKKLGQSGKKLRNLNLSERNVTHGREKGKVRQL